MKRVILMIVPALICGVVFTSCNSKSESTDTEEMTVCDGCTLPQENIPWLKNLIDSSKTDKTGNLYGCIWLENFKGQDIFVTNMGLGSGGVMYWFFDCSGNHFIHRDWGYDTCPACDFVGNHHVFFEDLEDTDFPMLNMKLDNLVYSNLPVPCK